jgi:hypothetical protein
VVGTQSRVGVLRSKIPMRLNIEGDAAAAPYGRQHWHLCVRKTDRSACRRPTITSLVPNLLNFLEVSNGYGEPDSWFESRSPRHELNI